MNLPDAVDGISKIEENPAFLPTPDAHMGTRGASTSKDKNRPSGHTRQIKLNDLPHMLPDSKVKHLPTPRANDGMKGENTPSDKRRATPSITAVDVYFGKEVKNLPTPTSSLAKGTDTQVEHDRKTPQMSAVSLHFPEETESIKKVKNFPTPTASLAKGADSPKEHDRAQPQLSAVSIHFPEERETQLQNQDVEPLEDRKIEWGEYEPAVRRWEGVLRKAPSPVQPNRNGNPRLTTDFVEWMMGLPEGHVTGVPKVARSNQLKILGNGVVPQQAEAALRILLKRIQED